MEEPLTRPFFKLFYLQAQGWLRHTQSLGCLTEVARLDDGDKRRKMAEFGAFIHWAPTLLLNSAGRSVRRSADALFDLLRSQAVGLPHLSHFASS